MDAAEDARKVYMRMQEELESNICGQVVERGRSNTATVDAVCDIANAATFGASMATAAITIAKTSFDELLQGALECSDFGAGQTLIVTAKRSMRQSRKAQSLAVSRAKRARAQCEQAKRATSQQEISQCLQVADEASQFATSQAKRAASLSTAISNELDKNICGNEVQLGRSEISAAAVCQITDSATAGASVATTAAKAAEERFSVLKQSVLACQDLQAGQGIIEAAKEVLKTCKESQKMTLTAANRARTQCRKARGASSEDELRGLIQEAEGILGDAMRASEVTANHYFQLRDGFDGQFCAQKVAAAPAGKESGGIDQRPSATTVAINAWLEKVAKSLYSKIPEHLLREYNAATIGSGCVTEGFNVNVRIDVLSRVEDRAFWVTYENCSNPNF